MRSTRDLPPLPSLRAFDAVARLLSFRRAGEELLITQSAVSHHVRKVEIHLGMRLFDRHAKSISLTKAGERYALAVARAFSLIEEATVEITGATSRPRVRISLLPSFAAMWLMPRLSAFRAAHPDIEFDIQPTLTTVDPGAGEVDIAIRYGDGRYAGVRAELLMMERLTPVLSPALASMRPVLRPADLGRHTLLFSRKQDEWDAWAMSAGIDIGAAEHAKLTDYNIVLQAALDGQGVAMGRTVMIASKLESGALVAPFDIAIEEQEFGYWLLSREHHRLTDPVELTREWLKRETGATS
jgi:LysR family glycine cleavage system transcriptional activator